MILIDDAVNLTNESHNSNTQTNYLHKRKKERKDLTESTNVMLVKYPPNVKSELFSQL